MAQISAQCIAHTDIPVMSYECRENLIELYIVHGFFDQNLIPGKQDIIGMGISSGTESYDANFSSVAPSSEKLRMGAD